MRHFLHCSLSATNATEKCRLKTVRHENRKTSEVLIVNDFGRYSCGGRTRTCDLQVMSLASYVSQLRLQRYDDYLKSPNISERICL